MTIRPRAVAEVYAWGRRVGAVSWNPDREVGAFEYDHDWLGAGTELSPFILPLERGVFTFPELARTSFRGLPGLVADSLPDRFGNLLVDAWLQRRGHDPGSFSPVEQLCYVGTRGMGALEYRPATRLGGGSQELVVDELADLAADVLAGRAELAARLDDVGLTQLFRVGTSAGGARAKAVIAWNPSTGEVRSGQLESPKGFEPWLLKFDGVGSQDRDLVDPKGYGRVEYAYYLMANALGIEMSEARLYVDGRGRAHFMTRRFDRDSGRRVHMQSLAALRHSDYNVPGGYSYEQAMSTVQGLGIGAPGVEQLYRRMVFNVVARNQDDHTKNIAFLMGQDGGWQMSPAFDVIWAYNPSGAWTSRHQMTINGKRDGFTRSDLDQVADRFGIGSGGDIIEATLSIVGEWKRFAAQADVFPHHQEGIGSTHRLGL